MKNFEDMQKAGQTNIDDTLRNFGEVNKSLQAVATELTEFSKRSYEDGTAAFEKLSGARTVAQAVEIQSDYLRRSYEEGLSQFSKIGNMFAALTRDAYKPVEKAMVKAR